MNRLKKLSHLLLLITNVLLIALPLLTLLEWLFMDIWPIKNLIADGVLLSKIETPAGAINLVNANMDIRAKAIGLTGSLIGSMPIFLAFIVLRKIFKNYNKSVIFTSQNAHYYRHLGWLFFIDALAIKPLSEMLSVLAVTFNNPPGQRWISLSFGTPNLEALFCGAIVIIISWVMVEGYKLQEEQELVV